MFNLSTICARTLSVSSTGRFIPGKYENVWALQPVWTFGLNIIKFTPYKYKDYKTEVLLFHNRKSINCQLWEIKMLLNLKYTPTTRHPTRLLTSTCFSLARQAYSIADILELTAEVHIISFQEKVHKKGRMKSEVVPFHAMKTYKGIRHIYSYTHS